MEIFIDFNQISQSPFHFGWWFMTTIGWIFPVFLFLYGLVLGWLNYIRNKYRAGRNYIVLSIDIPRNNEQTPLAIENFFNHLAGAHQNLTFIERWWDGEIPDSFSFEIISDGGYIQFLIHFVDRYRDLVEAIIYAQYPEAEITEVEDYTKKWQLKFPNNRYEMWGGQFITYNTDVNPIKTYEKFEHGSSEEYKDPLASMLEGFSRIGPGEQIWVQIIITPADNDWGERAKPVIDKRAGRITKAKQNWVGAIASGVGDFISAGVSTTSDSGSSVDDRRPPSLMLHLTPGERSSIEAIGIKASKIGYHTKIRAIYIAEKDKFNKKLGLNVIYGSFKQFNTTLNGFKPDFRKFVGAYTGSVRFFKKTRLIWRKRVILQRYKNRNHWLEPGSYGFILNTEELASIWHFPHMSVKTPLLPQIQAKKAEPPISLPREQAAPIRHLQPKVVEPAAPDATQPAQATKPAATEAEPPTNLPVA